MKEKLYTIELNDALKAGDECMFCWLERKLEQENLEFVLGSSYMESDIREQTSRQGFCRHHTKMMYDYGNTLGNAWILKSRMEHMNRELKRQLAQAESGKPGNQGKAEKKGSPVSSGSLAERGLSGLFSRKKAVSGGSSGAESWLKEEENHCYVCSRMADIYGRMLDTFIYMLRNDPAFGQGLLESKGFCMHHYGDVVRICEEKLKPEEQEQWMPKLGELMSRNLDRIQEDIDWLIEKFDYRNQDADWKQSKDAVQRTMQKLTGGYPADPVFKNRK